MSAPPDDPQKKRPEWLKNLTLPTLVVVLGALLVAILTPAGTAVREFVFPTKATISGTVELNGAPAGQATVRLAADASSVTDTAGRFQLAVSGAGRHKLHIEAPGARGRDYEFSVAAGADAADIGVIKIEPFVRLGYYASVQPPTNPTQPQVKYDVTLWLIGENDALAQVRTAAYTLPAPLPGTKVAGAGPAFCYRKQGSLPFEQLMVLGGAFAVASGTVALADGRTFAVSSVPGTDQPAACTAPPTTAVTIPPTTGTGSTQGNGNTGNTGSTKVPIPNVRLLEETDAVGVLKQAGFKTKTQKQTDDTIAEGRVIGTKPAAGTRVSRGTLVTVLISSGVPVTIPALKGLDQGHAENALADLGLAVSVKKIESDTKPGIVVDSDPAEGQSVPKGTLVTISVTIPKES